MILLKIQCPCGQRYSFDVIPENDRMPFGVACPVCKADGTEIANQALKEKLALIAAAPAMRIEGVPSVPAVVAAAPPVAYAPPPIRPAPKAPAQRRFQLPVGGKDGWATEETSLNKLGTQLVVACSIGAALLAWGIGGLHVPPMILGTVVAICGIVGGILNIYGRGPMAAGAIVGLVLALGGYMAVEYWIRSRESVYSIELTIAFVVGTLPGFGLQYGLQRALKKIKREVIA